MTSIEEEMKHDFLDQENDFFDPASYTTGSCYVAREWPQKTPFLKNFFWLENKINWYNDKQWLEHK